MIKKILSFLVLILLSTQPCVAGDTFTIYLTRHYDKQAEKSNPSLTEQGAQRAIRLAELLAEQPLSGVYSTDYNRTRQTALPLVNKLSQQLVIYDPRTPDELVKQVLAARQSVLIVGHSNTIPDLVHRFGGNARAIEESEYGALFKLHIEADGVSTTESQVTP